MQISDEEFDEVAERAVASLPAQLREAMENIIIRVEDEPDPEMGDLLGLYEGVPLTERSSMSPFEMPDVISIYSGPLQRMCATREELHHEIRVTVIHEIAHHFGIDDDRLHELGWA